MVRADGEVIWVVQSDTMLRVTPAEFIQEIDGLVYLLVEVPAGTRVVISSLEVVTDSMAVRVTADPAS